MSKLIIWNKETAKKELSKRLNAAKDSIRQMQRQWTENERTLFNTRGGVTVNGNDVSLSFSSMADLDSSDVNQSNTDVGANFVYKNFKFLHSQMSANPPSAVPRPTSNDPGDRRKADAADRLIRHALRKYSLQEEQDRTTFNTLSYGTGFLKTHFDPDKGEPIEFDDATQEVLLEGDISFQVPSTKDIFPDPDAKKWEDVRYVHERFYMMWEEAMFRFGPEMQNILEKYRITDARASSTNESQSKMMHDVVEVYQYWEKGLPHNGFQGRFCWHLADGTVLGEIGPNPHRFAPPAKPDPMDISAPPRILPPKARLPYHILTDGDMADTYWGIAGVSYQTALQDLYNRLMGITVDNLQAHGVARLIMPDTAEISDDSITNSAWDIVKYTGNVPPSFMEPMPLPAAIGQLQQMVRQNIDEQAGVNESMFGQQSREQSGFSMQYATNQGNMIRRRLFNKYVGFVEAVYSDYLDLVRKHWDEPKLISLLGKEKALESSYIKGADIEGGFDLVVEYGTSLSLDPTMRRQELMQMYPFFKEAGIAPRRILQLARLNELDNAYDLPGMAADRQREIFEEIITTGVYSAPRKLQDHVNMLAYCEEYVMTAEFKYLAPEIQYLIEQHIEERQALMGAISAGAGPAGGPAAPGAPTPPMPADAAQPQPMEPVEGDMAALING